MQSSTSNSADKTNANQREPMRTPELILILKLRWRILALCTGLAAGGSFLAHLAQVPTFYSLVRVGTYPVNPQPAISLMGMEQLRTYVDEEEEVKKYLNYLKSSSFHLLMARDVKVKSEEPNFQVQIKAPVNSLAPKAIWKRSLMIAGIHESKPQKSSETNLSLMPLPDLAQELEGMLEVSNDGTTLVIRGIAMDPVSSMVVANQAAQSFIKLIMERDRGEINEVQSFIEERLRETTEKLRQNEVALVAFKQKNNIVSTDETNKNFVDRYSKMEGDLESVRIGIQEKERLVQFYEAKLKERDLLNSRAMDAAPEEQTQGIDVVRRRIETIRKQRVLLQSQGLREEDTAITELNRNLSKDTERLRAFISAGSIGETPDDLSSGEIQERIGNLRLEIKQLNLRLGAITRTKDELKDALTVLPRDVQELVSLERAVALQYELYTQLKKQLQEVEIQKAGFRKPVKIEQAASVGQLVPRPRFVLRLVFGFLAGLFLGCVVILGIEFTDNTVKHRSDLEAADIVALGNIPYVIGDEARSRKIEVYRPDLLICANAPDSAESMAFKFLRAQLRGITNLEGQQARVISITSADRGEGKSFVTANIGVAFAQLAKKTIIVDCDFRNPSQPKYFGYENQYGLTSLLSMKATTSEVLIKDRVPNLDILPAGWFHDNPTELVSGEKFRLLIAYLKTKYDYVFIDSPPAVFVVDAAVISSVADATLLVARYRSTTRNNLLMAHRKILQISPKIVYGVLNGVKEVHEYVNYSATAYLDYRSRNRKHASGISNNENTKPELERFRALLDKDKTKTG